MSVCVEVEIDDTEWGVRTDVGEFDAHGKEENLDKANACARTVAVSVGTRRAFKFSSWEGGRARCNGEALRVMPTPMTHPLARGPATFPLFSALPDSPASRVRCSRSTLALLL